MLAFRKNVLYNVTFLILEMNRSLISFSSRFLNSNLAACADNSLYIASKASPRFRIRLIKLIFTYVTHSFLNASLAISTMPLLFNLNSPTNCFFLLNMPSVLNARNNSETSLF